MASQRDHEGTTISCTISSRYSSPYSSLERYGTPTFFCNQESLSRPYLVNKQVKQFQHWTLFKNRKQYKDLQLNCAGQDWVDGQWLPKTQCIELGFAPSNFPNSIQHVKLSHYSLAWSCFWAVLKLTEFVFAWNMMGSLRSYSKEWWLKSI